MENFFWEIEGKLNENFTWEEEKDMIDAVDKAIKVFEYQQKHQLRLF